VTFLGENQMVRHPENHGKCMGNAGKMMENHGTSLQISWNMVDLTKKHSKAFGFDGMCN